MSSDEKPHDEELLTILLYASDRTMRENVRLTLGRKVAADLPPVRVLEVATQPAVITAMDAGGIDLAILDGEAQPTGGLGVARTIRQECAEQPLLCVLIRRRDDRWLATWSQVDGTLMYPIDPVTAAESVAGLLRLAAGTPTR